MMYVADETLERILKEDAPYLDLTSWALNIGDDPGSIAYFGRERLVVCGTEEAGRICGKLGLDVTSMKSTGASVHPNEVFFAARGKAAALHMAWKALMGIFEHYSAIATRTQEFVRKATQANPRVAVVTTRKNVPGTRELSIKAVMAGGALPHRLGLSETVVIFKQHRVFVGGDEGLVKMIPAVKARAPEKKVIAEADSIDLAVRLCKAGIDGIQFDKFPPPELACYVAQLRALNPALLIIAAGGIDEKNVAEYAATGVDTVVTTSVYMGKPADIGCRMEKIAA